MFLHSNEAGYKPTVPIAVMENNLRARLSVFQLYIEMTYLKVFKIMFSRNVGWRISKVVIEFGHQSFVIGRRKLGLFIKQ